MEQNVCLIIKKIQKVKLLVNNPTSGQQRKYLHAMKFNNDVSWP